MTVAEFLFYLRTHKVRLWAEGGQLRVNAPKGVLTAELRQSIASRKAEILSFLSEAKEATSADATTIKPIPRTGPLPLSFSQQRLWVLHQFNPQDASYHLPFALHIKGDLDRTLLQRCLDEIVRRHEALRTTFAATNDTITQVIAPPQPVTLALTSLESQPAAEQAATVRQIIAEEAQRPFDLSQGPLLRGRLLQLGAQEHVVSLTIHHIISDGWSLGVFARELMTLYEAFSAEKPSPLPELPIQYADFAAWQRQWLSGEVFDRQLAYWKNQLAGAPAKLALPTDRPRPPVQSFKGARYLQLLPQQLSSALNELGQQEEATLFMVLLAAFQTLLVRYTGQDDIVIGTATAGRELAELNEVIGYFANTLPLRTDLTGNPTFRQALRRVRQTCLEAYAHQDMPFERLVKELADDRDLSYAPIFQVLLVLQNAATDTIRLPGLTLSYLESHGGAARFDLSLDVAETPEGLHCAYEYNTDLFDTTTIARMAEHFQSLLHDITAQPDRRLFDLALLAETDLQQLSAWNASSAEYPRAQCIHQLFEAQAERTPDSIAVVFGDQQLSYAALNAQANRLAHRLQALGVSADVMVGLCIERSLDLIVGVLGILKAGGAYVPLDPTYPASRLQFMLTDAQVPVVVTQSHLVEQFPLGNAGEAEIAPVVVCLDRDSEIAGSAQLANPQIQMTPDNLAYVIYTSGSTGRPKGVQIPHQTVVNFLTAMQGQPGLSANDRLLAVTTLSFDIAALEIFLPLVTGAQVVLTSREVASDGVQLASLLEREAITVMQATPATWRMLLHAGWQGQPDLKILCGGEALPRLLADQLLSRGASLWNMYGPTETTIWSAVARVATETGDVPIGGPIANTQLHVLDRQMQRVPVGVAGELYIGGEGLARGYLNRPELTAERFVPDPFAVVPGARLYRVGDLMRYRADGTLEFLGRIDQQVKVRGYRIEIGEIESALSQHLAVREAVVLARQDTGSESRLVAYVVENQEPRTKNLDIEADGSRFSVLGSTLGEGLDADSLRRFLHERLPEYMVPARFIFLDALPLTPNGKVDRKALPEPDTSRPELEIAFVAPRTAAEQTLADIWKQVLGLEQVGIHDNFFALGGDSILSFQIVARAAEAGYNLTAAQIFQHRTIAELAPVMSAREHVAAEQGLATGPVPLTPIQRWFFEQQPAKPAHFNQSRLLESRRPLDVAPLSQALQQVMQHHEAFGLRFARNDHGWQQINPGEIAPVSCRQVDLAALAHLDQRAALEQVAAEAQASLDLEAGPLVRAVLFDLGADQPQRLLLVIHHLVVDRVSWRILLDDLQSAYSQLMRDSTIALPPQTAAFQRWAEQLSAYAQSEAAHAELSYWRQVVDRPLPALPLDEPGGANLIASTHEITRSLTADETRALLQDVPPVYHTQIDDVLLAALAQGFAVWTGQTTLLLDLEGHGREESRPGMDLSRTIGWFTSIFPVALELTPAADPGAALRAIKEQLRLIPRGGVGYGVLRYLNQDAQIAEQLRSRPGAQISFSYQGQTDQLPASALFGVIAEASGPNVDPQAQRPYLLEISGVVSDGQLRLRWLYSEQIHRRATIEAFAEHSMAALRAIINHCLAPEAGGFTPSDFPAARVNQKELDKLFGMIGKKGGPSRR